MTERTILTPGIHDGIPESVYHGDSYSMPALSCGVLKDLTLECPMKAWLNHPALNPDYVDAYADESKFDIGNAAHALLLEGETAVDVLPFDSYRTKEAQLARDAVRDAGKIPMLPPQWESVVAMTEAAQIFLRDGELEIKDMADGNPERTLVWVEDGQVMKARPDWMPSDNAFCLDYKTTGKSANPADLDKHCLFLGYDIQDWHYSKGLYELTGREIPFVFLFQETKAPYLCSLISLSPQFRELGMTRANKARAIWDKCMADGVWPGYPDRIAYVDPPGWAAMQILTEVEEAG